VEHITLNLLDIGGIVGVVFLSTAMQNPMSRQAQNIIDKFGGVASLVASLKRAGFSRHRTAIYYWTWPKARGGTNGLIPTSALLEVLAAARLEGIYITVEELYPEVYDTAI